MVNVKHVDAIKTYAPVSVTDNGLTSMADDASAFTGSKNLIFTLKATTVDGSRQIILPTIKLIVGKIICLFQMLRDHVLIKYLSKELMLRRGEYLVLTKEL